MSTLTQTKQSHTNNQLKLTTVGGSMTTTTNSNSKISQVVREKYLNVPLNYQMCERGDNTKMHKNGSFVNKLQYYWYLYLIHLPCHLLLTNIDSFFIYLIINSILFGGMYYGFSLVGMGFKYLLA